MKVHCEICWEYLSDYLYGKGGAEEKAIIGTLRKTSLPDVVCFKCYPSGINLSNQLTTNN